MDLARLVVEGGALARLVLLVGLVGGATAVALTAISLAVPRRRLAVASSVVLGVLALLAIGAGWLGWAGDLRTVRAAIAYATPESAPRLLAMGSAEARACLELGFAAAILPVLGLGLTLARVVPARPSGFALAGGAVLGLSLALAAGDVAARQLRIAAVERLWAEAPAELRATARPPRVFDMPEAYGPGTFAGAAGAVLGAILLAVAARREQGRAHAPQGGGSWPVSS